MTDTSVHKGLVSLLAGISFLQDLPVTALEELAAQATPQTFEAGTTICRRGEPGSCLYIVERGEVEIYLPSRNGNGRIVLIHVGPGRVFGEMAVIDKRPRSASAAALVPTHVWMIPREPFRIFLRRYPDAAIGLLEHLSGLLRGADDQIEAVSSETQLLHADERED